MMGQFTPNEVNRIRLLVDEEVDDIDLILELICMARQSYRANGRTPLPFITALYSELGIGLTEANRFVGSAFGVIGEIASKPEQTKIATRLRICMQEQHKPPQLPSEES